MSDVNAEEGWDSRYLNPSTYVDSDSEAVRGFVARALAGLPTNAGPAQKAVCLFEAVRDGIRYDPYTFALDVACYRASAVVGDEANFCVPKAILLTACLRAAGIPAAVGFADVRNHLTTPRLMELMETDVFMWHGYVQLWLDGRPFKVTPAFNIELCERFGVKPLVFDGTSDALFHEYDAHDRRHMEYVADHGFFVDPPMDEYLTTLRARYPKLEAFNRERDERGARGVDAGFAAEAADT